MAASNPNRIAAYNDTRQYTNQNFSKSRMKVNAIRIDSMMMTSIKKIGAFPRIIILGEGIISLVRVSPQACMGEEKKYRMGRERPKLEMNSPNPVFSRTEKYKFAGRSPRTKNTDSRKNL